MQAVFFKSKRSLMAHRISVTMYEMVSLETLGESAQVDMDWEDRVVEAIDEYNWQEWYGDGCEDIKVLATLGR